MWLHMPIHWCMVKQIYSSQYIVPIGNSSCHYIRGMENFLPSTMLSPFISLNSTEIVETVNLPVLPVDSVCTHCSSFLYLCKQYLLQCKFVSIHLIHLCKCAIAYINIYLQMYYTVVVVLYSWNSLGVSIPKWLDKQ